MQDWMVASFLCYDLSQNPVFELRKRCINQNEAESVTLRYSLYIYLTNPRGLYVTSPNVVLALSSLHYVMQAPLLRILRHINVIEKWTRYTLRGLALLHETSRASLSTSLRAACLTQIVVVSFKIVYLKTSFLFLMKRFHFVQVSYRHSLHLFEESCAR